MSQITEYDANVAAVVAAIDANVSTRSPISREAALTQAWRLISRGGFDSATISAGYEAAVKAGIITQDEANQ